MERTPKKSNSRLQLIIAVMIMTALFLAELYVMINESNNIVLLVGIAVLILIALYFVVDAILDCTNEKDIANRELYDDIHRSEKASYMLLKKNLEEILKQVKTLDGGKNEDLSAEIIKSQKAVAKVAMSKTKETQDRLFIELNNLEASLKDSIGGLSQKLSGFQEEIERLADHIAKINEEAILAASKNMQEIKTIVSETPISAPVVESFVEEEPVVLEEVFEDVLDDGFEEETTLEDSLADLLGEEVSVESEMDELDSLLTDITSDVEEPANELDFGELDLGALDLDVDVASPAESEDDILSQLLAAEEAPIEEEEIDVLAELTKAVEESPIEEPTPAPAPAPAPTPAPTPADNGGKMGQDDIAALIASMTGGDSAPAPEPEPAPAPAPAPADNGGKMNQDDIAALIASMTN